MRPRVSRTAYAFAVGGYAFTAILLCLVFLYGGWQWPGPDAYTWDRVGDQIRAGASPYFWPESGRGFYYAPPWAIGLAVVTWLPTPGLNLAINAVEIVALRYIAGSWLRVGFLCWVPLVALELSGAQWNLVMAAGIAAAIRGKPSLAVVMGAAKLSPLLAIARGDWRRALPVAAVLVALTIPWLSLWPEWIAQLAATYGVNIAPGAQLEIPFAPRLALAAALVVIGRPWTRGLAAVVATPALYWVSGLLLLALLPARGPVGGSHDAGTSQTKRG